GKYVRPARRDVVPVGADEEGGAPRTGEGGEVVPRPAVDGLDGEEQRHVGSVAPRSPGHDGEVGLIRGEGGPDRIVEGLAQSWTSPGTHVPVPPPTQMVPSPSWEISTRPARPRAVPCRAA